MQQEPFALNPQQKASLLALARKSIEHFLATGKHLDNLPALDDAVLEEKRGVFVTLHKQGDLRGCVGITDSVKPLIQAVAYSAVQAAFYDSRFEPLRRPELSDIEIQISCLSTPTPVQNLADIELGRHGIVLEKKSGRGFGLGAKAVYLPAVAIEEGWDLATTLSHLSVKAGLVPDAWKNGCLISVFQTIVFKEGELIAS